MIGGLLFALTIVCLFVVPSESAGVTVSVQAKLAFLEMKIELKYRHVIYFISEKKDIDVESTGDPDSSLENFLQQLNNLKNQCRYIVYDKPVGDRSELILIKWVPEAASTKQKLLYNSGYEAIKRALVGVHTYIQASDLEAIKESLNENGSD